MKPVYITIVNRGWIIEKLARKITDSLDYVDCGFAPPTGTKIIYRMPYMTFAKREASIEIAYFTHIEEDPIKAARFWSVARSVDHCTSQSKRYASILAESGIKCITITSPGVDLDKYTPKVRIGIVGRTYPSGRKGESLVKQMMDIPGIEWYFTGAGWPGRSVQLTDDQMPLFYNSMDYILISSLNEGGPMCVIEALACGRQVIAPDIGWVNEFPHIQFRTGDSESLRSTLIGIVSNRLSLRESVLDRTWQAWISTHDELFRLYLKHTNP